MAAMAAAWAAESEPPYLLVFMLDDLFQLPGASAEMKSLIWGTLPAEILELVLLLVPAATQARFKSVCKRWRKLLISEEFKKKSARLAFSSASHICGFVHRDAGRGLWGGAAGDPVGMQRVEQLEVHYKVHKLSLDFLPRSIAPTHSSLRHVADGLMIFSGESEVGEGSSKCKQLKLYLVNAANRTWIELPSVDLKRTNGTWENRSMSVRVHEKDGQLVQFKVIVFSTHHHSPQTRQLTGTVSSCTLLVYCSTTDAWSKRVTSKTNDDRHLLLSQITDRSSRPCAFGKELIYAVPDHHVSLLRRDITRDRAPKSVKIKIREFRSDTGQYVGKLLGPYRAQNSSLVVMKDEEGKEVLMAIPELRNNCGIWVFSPTARNNWDPPASMPTKLIAKFRPPGLDVYANGAEMVEDVVMVRVEVASPDEPDGRGEYGIVAYHVPSKSWEIVLNHRSLLRGVGVGLNAMHARIVDKIKHGVLCTRFFQPKPRLQLSGQA